MFESLFACVSIKLGSNAQYGKIGLQFISDADMYLFFEKDMRDGVS